MLREMAGILVMLSLAGCTPSSTAPTGTGGGGGGVITHAPVNIQIIAGDSQTDTVRSQLPLAITISITDSQLVGVPNQPVNWVVTLGGGHVYAAATNTDSLGHASQIWTLGDTATVQRLEARAIDPSTGQPVLFATIHATATPGLPVFNLSGVWNGDTTIAIGDTFDFASRINYLRDAYNNFVPVSSVTIGGCLWDGGSPSRCYPNPDTTIAEPFEASGRYVVPDSAGYWTMVVFANHQRLVNSGLIHVTP